MSEHRFLDGEETLDEAELMRVFLNKQRTREGVCDGCNKQTKVYVETNLCITCLAGYSEIP